MSEETAMTEGQSDKEQNFEKLREQVAARDARIEELLPYAVNETIRKVGLDPDSGNGIVLKDIMGSDPSLERAQELVSKYGWDQQQEQTETATSSAPQPTQTEQAALDAANRQQQVQSVATSSQGAPLSAADKIAEANARLSDPNASQDEKRRAASEQIHAGSELLLQQFNAQR